jgi:hypothetical protein
MRFTTKVKTSISKTTRFEMNWLKSTIYGSLAQPCTTSVSKKVLPDQSVRYGASCQINPERNLNISCGLDEYEFHIKAA